MNDQQLTETIGVSRCVIGTSITTFIGRVGDASILSNDLANVGDKAGVAIVCVHAHFAGWRVSGHVCIRVSVIARFLIPEQCSSGDMNRFSIAKQFKHTLANNSQDCLSSASIVAEDSLGAEKAALFTSIEVELDGVLWLESRRGNDTESFEDGDDARAVIVCTWTTGSR